MSRIARAFARPGSKALATFLTCGHPDVETTLYLVAAVSAAGADVVVLGIPFSDPTIEGPVLQAANVRACEAGVTTADVISCARRVREASEVPLVVMGYANVVYSYGIARFAADAAEAGCDAVIVSDVPFEESEEFSVPLGEAGLRLVPFVAPSTRDRTPEVLSVAADLVVCEAFAPGAAEHLPDMAARVRAACDVPCVAGLDDPTPEEAARAAALCDGVLVETGVMRIVSERGREALPAVREHVAALADAVHGA